MTFQERIRSRLREEAAHHAPEPAHYPPDPMQTFHVDNVASTRDERDTQGTLHNRPTEDYQARVTPILARLRAEGVRFDDSPRRFNFARELIRPPGSSDLSSSTTTNATPVPRLTRPQRTSAVPPPRLIWDGRTLWHTAGASETTRDSEREPAHDSETETEGQPGH